jgi:hypothetical protein
MRAKPGVSTVSTTAPQLLPRPLSIPPPELSLALRPDDVFSGGPPELVMLLDRI